MTPVLPWKKSRLDDPSVVVVSPRPGPVHWTLVLISLALFGWLYLWLAHELITTTNLNPAAQDQKHNMRQALLTRPSLHPDWSRGIGQALTEWLPHRTDGVVAPLWPWIAAHFARADHAIDVANFQVHTPLDEEFFTRGRWVNVAITGIFLAAVVVWCGARFTVLGTVNFMILAGLGAFLPRAVYFQPEPLYLCLFFACWVVTLAMLESNPLRLYALFGVLCGLAWLTKASIQPLVAAWFAAMSVRFLGCALPGRWKASSERWHPRHHVIGTLLGAVIFFLLAAPQMAFAHERWGRPFFSYPARWMWMDDFENQGYQWMRDHPGRAALDAVPADEWPSFPNYLRTHTPEEMWTRLRVGVRDKLTNLVAPKPTGEKGGTPERPWKRLLEPRGLYLGALAAILGAVAIVARRRPEAVAAAGTREPFGLSGAGGRIDWARPLGQIVFVAGVVSACALAYGWYTPVGRGDRFMIPLYAPLAFTFIAAAERQLRKPMSAGRAAVVRQLYAAMQFTLLALLVWRISELVTGAHFDPAVR